MLLLDEPSSGLDSHAALHLMQTLKQVGRRWLDTAGCKLSWAASRSRPRGCCAAKPLMLPAGAAPPAHALQSRAAPCPHGCVQVARAGRIVLLSSHQPSPPMFALLDRAYLLAGGVCVFAGPPDAVRPRFAALGLPCPAEEAPAERMLEVGRDGWCSCTGAGSKEDSSVRGAVCRWVVGTGGTRAKARTTLATTSPLQPATLCPGGQRPAAAGPAAASGKQARIQFWRGSRHAKPALVLGQRRGWGRCHGCGEQGRRHRPACASPSNAAACCTAGTGSPSKLRLRRDPTPACAALLPVLPLESGVGRHVLAHPGRYPAQPLAPAATLGRGPGHGAADGLHLLAGEKARAACTTGRWHGAGRCTASYRPTNHRLLQPAKLADLAKSSGAGPRPPRTTLPPDLSRYLNQLLSLERRWSRT